MRNKHYSFWSLILIPVFLIAVFFYFDLWKKNRIIVDAPSYYTYLPALIIHHDLQLDYISKNPEYYKNKVWYYTIENNKKLIKHPMGISVMLAPFFMIGHWIAGLTGAVQDGYSMPYQNSLSIGVIVYLFAGLFFLRKILLDHFSEKITALTLITIVFATNLLWYSTFEGLMPHAITFSLWCAAIYCFFQWIKKGERKALLCFSAAFGLIVLIRPLSIVAILYFLVYGIISKGGIKQFIAFMKPRAKEIFLGVLIAFLIAALQLVYWKYATGKWLYDVYRDEHFIFNSPQIIPFLFSFRKGVFIYTPILIFALVGMITYFKNNSALFWSTLFLMGMTIYLLASWWAWSYGISWGIRPMIDYYAVLSLPLAAGFQFLFNRFRIISITTGILVFLFVILNLFQTWQYKNGLIHYDDMSKEAYFKGFFQTRSSIEWADLLKPYDWERRIKGLPQINYSSEFFHSLDKKQTLSFRATNLLYVAVNEKAQKAMGALSQGPGLNGEFYIEHLGGQSICIRSTQGLLWSLKPEYENAVLASASSIGSAEKFTFEYLDEDDNRIALKAANGKYISIGDQWPFILKANSETLGKNETFRFLVITR
ncbi:MAG TPA: glycosyltransferase family 39 protein [Bacteroidia bacterium]|jgi:hypothetical protein